MPESPAELVDLIAALGEHVLDIERRLSALENRTEPPRPIAASDLRRVTKALMRLSLLTRREAATKRVRRTRYHKEGT